MKRHKVDVLHIQQATNVFSVRAQRIVRRNRQHYGAVVPQMRLDGHGHGRVADAVCEFG